MLDAREENAVALRDRPIRFVNKDADLMRTITDPAELEKLTGISEEYRSVCLRLLWALFPELERVILFGSRARGKFTQGSDIDLALDCGEQKPIENKRRLIEAKDVINELRFHYQCDLSDYRTAEGLFKEAIEEEGIVWGTQKPT